VECLTCGMTVRPREIRCGNCGARVQGPVASRQSDTNRVPRGHDTGLIRIPDDLLPRTVEEPHDGARDAIEATRVAPRAERPRVWVVRLPTGETLPIEGAMVLGRDPVSPDHPDRVQRVAVDDPGRSVSKTHASFDVVDGRLLVSDLASTNGVVVVHADGREVVPQPGQQIPVPDGCSIALGTYVVTVELV
jgi:FHA domain